MVMTPEEYAEKGGVLCPVCGPETEDNAVEGRQVDISFGRATQQCTCSVCHAEWTDEYKLVGYSNLEQEEQVRTEKAEVSCLACGSGEVTVNLDGVYRKYWCKACGTEWADRLVDRKNPEQEELQCQ